MLPTLLSSMEGDGERAGRCLQQRVVAAETTALETCWTECYSCTCASVFPDPRPEVHTCTPKGDAALRFVSQATAVGCILGVQTTAALGGCWARYLDRPIRAYQGRDPAWSAEDTLLVLCGVALRGDSTSRGAARRASGHQGAKPLYVRG